MVCCSWEGGGVSLPVVTLSNDVLCTAPSTHPLHHSTMHNAQNVLKCTFLYPLLHSLHTATKAKCSQCSQHKLEHTTSMHSVYCTHQKSKSIVLPPCRPMLYSSTAILLLGAPLFLCGSNVESASMLVSLLVCAGPGQEGEQILRYLCRRNMHNTTHRHTWLNNMCMQRYMC